MTNAFTSAINDFVGGDIFSASGGSPLQTTINNYVSSATGSSGGSLFDSYQAWNSTWGANVTNASITGALTALGSMIGAFTAGKAYKRYEQQEKLYLEAAAENARRLQLKGEIALRNLRMEHAISQGSRELSAAAGGGRLSGSTLEVLTSSRKAEISDERTQSLETLWAVTEAKKQGLNNAIQTAWGAVAQAEAQKASVWQGLFKGLAVASDSITKDVDANRAKKYELNKTYGEQGRLWQEAFHKYGFDSTGQLNPLTNSPISEEIDTNYNLILNDLGKVSSILT